MARLVRPRSLSYSVPVERVTPPSLSHALLGAAVWGLLGFLAWALLLASQVRWATSTSAGFALGGVLVVAAMIVGAVKSAR